MSLGLNMRLRSDMYMELDMRPMSDMSMGLNIKLRLDMRLRTVIY